MLEHFFGSKTRLKLLKVFFRSPEQQFYVRELARLINIQLHAVRREIANLERIGIIIPVAAEESNQLQVGRERSKYYQLHTESMLYTELKALLLKAELLEEKELVEGVKTRGGDVKLFLLTGLFTQQPEVGTDMLLVGAIKPVVLSRLIHDYEQETGKEVRYTLMDEQEFKDRREIGDRFLFGIFEGKHIMVVNEFNLS